MTTDFKVHRIRFYNPELSSINSMSYDEDSKRLAVIRRLVKKFKQGQSDAWSRIEIWNMRLKAPFVEQIIDEDVANPGLLESVEWMKDGRLVSCGLNAFLNEYDCLNSCIKRSYAVTSGPAWCMAVNGERDKVAVGTEDGYVCVFVVGGEQLDYDKILDRHDQRILCVSWMNAKKDNEDLIIAGSIGLIKIWNYTSGRCIDHINVGQEIIVWCLTVLKDMTIVSGDSSGATSFWNGKTCTLMATHKSHKADVLCLCANVNETLIYSAGVDHSVMQFAKSADKAYPNHPSKWLVSLPLNFHTHDVRSLVFLKQFGSKSDWLISGGIDNYLIISRYPNMNLRHVPEFKTKIHFCDDNILMQYENTIQIWKLGVEEEDILMDYNGDLLRLPLAQQPLKLIELKSRKTILASGFSKNWICYATCDVIKLLNKNKSGDELKRVALLCEPIINVRQIAFIGEELVAINSGSVLQVLKLDVLGVMLIKRIEFEFRIHEMRTNEKYLILSVADKSNSIFIYDININQIANFVNPTLPCAFEINDCQNNYDLWLAFANHRLVQFAIEENRIKKTLSVRECLPTALTHELDEYWCFKHITFTDGYVLLADDNLMYKLDIAKERVNKCDKYRHVLKLGNVPKLNQLIVVEFTPEMLFNRLPTTLAKKKFGT